MRRLTAYAAAKAGYPFSLQIFSSIEQLLDCRRKKQPEAILLAGWNCTIKRTRKAPTPTGGFTGQWFCQPGGTFTRSSDIRMQKGILQDIVKACTALVPEVHACGIQGELPAVCCNGCSRTVCDRMAGLGAGTVPLREAEGAVCKSARAWPVTISLTGAQGQSDLGELCIAFVRKRRSLWEGLWQ